MSRTIRRKTLKFTVRGKNTRNADAILLKIKYPDEQLEWKTDFDLFLTLVPQNTLQSVLF